MTRTKPSSSNPAAACACGSGRTRSGCCGPFLDGERPAPTAEALMRSRYCAFVEHRVDYLHETLEPKGRADHDQKATRKWAEQSEWLGLEILSVTGGGESDDAGEVEFLARFRADGQRLEHRELATFARHDGRWCFVNGRPPKPRTFTREGPVVGRNDPCACGSGRKAKKCCAA